jgi:serine/threonine-protein kinase
VGASTSTYGGGTAAPVEPADDEEPSRSWVVWVLIGVAVLAIGGIIWLLMRGNSTGPEETLVEVPDVVGLNEERAKQLIEDADLVFVPVRVQDDEVPAGEVISTDPEAGEEVPEGTEVEVTISSGPSAIAIPDVEGRTQEEARQILAEAGFDPVNITVQTEDHPEIPKDMATRTDPPAGEEVPPDTPIVLYVSTGVVQLPAEIIGMTEAEAIQTVTSLGLTPVVRYEPTDQAEPGRVIRTEPAPGAVPQNSPITIVVAEEPEVETTVVPVIPPGTTCRDALAALGNASLNGDCRYDNGDRANNNDVVVRLNPAAGQQVPVGTTVTVVVQAPPSPGDDEGDG